MTSTYKLNSTVKTIAIADVTTVTGQPLDKHGIVFVGDRCGVVVEKLSDTEITVDFDSQKDFTCRLYDPSNLPKAGQKLYIDTSNGKLTKNSSGTKFVGFFWKEMGGAVIFSL